MTDELALVENVQREDLHPLEESEAMQGLMDRHSYTQEELAAVIGKARPTVTNTLKLNSLPQRIKDECLTSHAVAKSVLLEIVRLPEDQRLAFWDQVKDGQLTVKRARTRKRKQRPRPRDPVPLVLKAGAAFRDRLKALGREIGEEEREQLLEIHREVGQLLKNLATSP